MSSMALTRLTLYLLGEEVAEPAQALNRDKTPSSVELSPDCGFEGVFYYESRPATPPAWVTFVGPLLAAPPQRLLSASASGLLVLKASQRLFAITFGHGRGFLDLSRIEHRFGLRVALNRIDPSQIRSLDTKTFEDMVVTRNTQVSRSSELPAFGVDISRDILRAVTGEPRDKSLAKRLSGADALVVNVEIASSALSTLCAELLAAYQEDSYKENFAWIDHLGLVVDAAVRDALDEQLVEQLRVGDTSSTHMAMPEAIGWEDIDTFKITGTRSVEYDDLDLDAYLAQLGVKRSRADAREHEVPTCLNPLQSFQRVRRAVDIAPMSRQRAAARFELLRSYRRSLVFRQRLAGLGGRLVCRFHFARFFAVA